MRTRSRLQNANCAARSPKALEATLFGYEKGAFVHAEDSKAGLFESANGGTIFLEEVGKISPATQVKLLRVIQERQVIRVG